MLIAIMSYLTLTNFIFFQLSWFCCAFFRDAAVPFLIVLLGLHFYLSKHRQRDLKLLLIVAPIGICVDLLLIVTGVLDFESAYFFPLWLMGLWCAFALSIAYSLAWLNRLNGVTKILIGGIAGPFSYYAGGEIGALEVMSPVPLSLFYMVVIGGFLLSFLSLLYTNYIYTK